MPLRTVTPCALTTPALLPLLAPYFDVFGDEAVAAVPDQFADEISLSGPRDRIREKIKDWENSPVTSMLISGDIAMLREMAELTL